MGIQKFRWSRVYESSEEELVELLQAQNTTAERWTAEEFKQFQIPNTQSASTIWCAEGSLTVQAGGSKISLQPGDGLRISANSNLTAAAGISGCVCYESTATA